MLAIAEMKCQQPEDYEAYCIHFAYYLNKYTQNPSLAKKYSRSIYGTTPR